MSVVEPPAGLVAAIDARLEGRSRAALQASAHRLSEAYRARRSTEAAIRDETDALAYALTRMPATYAAVATALARLAEHAPDFTPKGVLDVGCGLGAATSAAAALWPRIEATLLDRSQPFLTLAQQLIGDAGLHAPGAIVEADLRRLPELPPHDLVVVAYALTELDDAVLAPLAKSLWTGAAGALVIVEPGTPRDFRRLMGVRATLIDAGATILAPCPHNAPCPIRAPDWCHFSVRLPRRRDHRLLKGGDAPFEDEKFAYLVAAHSGGAASARVLARPRAAKAGVTVKLCGQNGIHETFIPKRDKPRYEGIRRKDWGDAAEAAPSATAPETRE